MKAIVIHIVFVLLFQLVIINYSRAGDTTNCINGSYTIVFDCIPTIQGKALQDGDVISIFSETDAANPRGSLVYYSNSDSTNSISIGTDSMDVAMPNASNSNFFVSSQFFGCTSTNVNYTSDTADCILYITSFSAKFHYVNFTETIICSNSPPIPLDTDLPEGTFNFTSNPKGLKFGTSGEILPAESTPDNYLVLVETDYCLSLDSIEIRIDASTPGERIENISVCKGTRIADIDLGDRENLLIAAPDIDNQYVEINEEGLYPLIPAKGSCVVDSIYIDVIENPIFKIGEPIDKCDHVLIDVISQDSNDKVVYYNSTGEISKEIFEDSYVFVEVTNEFECSSIDSIDVKVNILQLTSATFNKEDAECWKEGKILINEDESTVKNNEGNVSYRLRNTINNSIVRNLDEVPEGKYNLQVVDERDCTAENESSIVVVQDCLENYPVFTPDGDNIEDSYFIPHEGLVKIYNRDGQLLRELETPEYWDGKDGSGNVLPMGNYLLITDKGKPVNITIIR